MSDKVSFQPNDEGDVNELVKQYLQCSGFKDTSACFSDEATRIGKTISVSSDRALNQKTKAVSNNLVQLFRFGKRKEFFEVFNSNIPRSLLDNNTEAQSLIFKLNLHFAIFHLRSDSHDDENNMLYFKHYLETQGSSLSQTTDFLPFFALPFIPEPRKHPSFQEIFTDFWIDDLQVSLEHFLSHAFEDASEPRLLQLYRSAELRNHELQKVQQTAVIAERRAVTYMNRHKRMQQDYSNLITIAAELVDALESCVQGQMITPEYLHNLCVKLFTAQNQQQQIQSKDLARPDDLAPDDDIHLWRHEIESVTSFLSPRNSPEFSGSGTAGKLLRQSIHDPPPYARQETARDNMIEKIENKDLDFIKIKHDLISAPERLKGLILQALRWRLTRTSPGEIRNGIIKCYVSNDLFGLTKCQAEHLEVLLTSKMELVRQYTARLCNAMVSVFTGRSYFASSLPSIKLLMKVLRDEKTEFITLENILGSLQKLSLRRNMQTEMIDNGMIEWLTKSLEDYDSLNDYTLEYCVALMMNLCLRKAGKKRCEPFASRAIKVLTDLLGYENHEIKPYINGAIYSIIASPESRQVALNMDLEEILKCFISDDTPEFNKQYNYIIQRLKNPDENSDEDSDDEQDDFDEDDETIVADLWEDQDAMEADLDKVEQLRPEGEELSGEQLLLVRYSRSTSSSGCIKKPSLSAVEDDGKPLQRPATPASRSSSKMNREVRNSYAELTPKSSITSSTDSRTTDSASTSTPTPSDDETSSKDENNSLLSKVDLHNTSPYNEIEKAFAVRPKIPRTPDPLDDTKPYDGHSKSVSDIDTRARSSPKAESKQRTKPHSAEKTSRTSNRNTDNPVMSKESPKPSPILRAARELSDQYSEVMTEKSKEEMRDLLGKMPDVQPLRNKGSKHASTPSPRQPVNQAGSRKSYQY